MEAGVVDAAVKGAGGAFESAVCLAFLVRAFASGFSGVMAFEAFAFLLLAAACFLALVVLGFGVGCDAVAGALGVDTGSLVGEIVGGGWLDGANGRGGC